MPSSSLRAEIAELVRLAAGDLDEVWRLATDQGIAAEALMDVLPDLIDTYGLAAGALAAEWYDGVREAQGVGGRFTAIQADIPDSGARQLVQWAAGTASDLTAMQALILGGTQRRIANHARQTIMGSSYADPQAAGWMRVARVGGCRFCQMLASRGAIYSERSVRFGAHDDCECQAAPKFHDKGDLFDVEDYRRSVRRWNGDRKTASAEADDARARDWIANNL